MKISKLALPLVASALLSLPLWSQNMPTYTFGSDATFPPMEFVDTATKSVVGFDVDMINAIGKAAGVELKTEGIHVLAVCPGYVRTAFSENAVRGNELKKVRPASVRGITAERVARATLRGYLKQKREVIVPWTMHLPVKLYQLFPAVVEWAMGKIAK